MAILSSTRFYQITLDPTNLRYPCKHPWIFDELSRPPMAAKHRSFPRRRFPQGPLPFEGEESQVLWAPRRKKWKNGTKPGKNWSKMVPGLPSGYVKIAIENGHRNSGFTHWKWWFSIVMLVYQRVIHAFLQLIRPKSSECWNESWGFVFNNQELTHYPSVNPSVHQALASLSSSGPRLMIRWE